MCIYCLRALGCRSIGRTTDSGSVNQGSSPCSPASIMRPHRLAGPGQRPFTPSTGVQIPLGTPNLGITKNAKVQKPWRSCFFQSDANLQAQPASEASKIFVGNSNEFRRGKDRKKDRPPPPVQHEKNAPPLLADAPNTTNRGRFTLCRMPPEDLQTGLQPVSHAISLHS